MGAANGLRERKKDRTRTTLIHVGLRLLARDGYDAVTVGAIAAAAEVSRATFFNYFPSKEELVLAHGTIPHRALMAEAFEQRSSEDSARAVLLAGVRRTLRSDAWEVPPDDELVAIRARLLSTVPALRAAFLGQLADLQREWTELLDAEFADLPRDQAATLVGAMTGAITNAVLTHLADGGSEEAIPAVADRAAATVLHG